MGKRLEESGRCKEVGGGFSTSEQSFWVHTAGGRKSGEEDIRVACLGRR